MRHKRLSVYNLSIYNLKQKSFRTIGLIFLVAILSFVLFGGSILANSLENGLESVQSKFGADLIILPEGNDSNMESILLRGEPSYFYFDKSFANKISEIDGIDKLSTQFYFSSTGSECCDLSIQIIGFDKKTDFTIQPWISNVFDEDAEDSVIVGSDIPVGNEKNITFYGKKYKISAQLEKTGTGLDQSAFAEMNVISDIYNNAKEKGFSFVADIKPNDFISSILIKVKDGQNINDAASAISKTLDGVQVIKTQNMLSNVTNNLKSFIFVIYIIEFMFFVFSLLVLFIVFSVSANERKKEFATFRTLGATKGKLIGIVMNESFLISTIGGIIGIAFVILIILPFSVYIGNTIGLPYFQPSTFSIFLTMIVTLIISSVVGPLASVYFAFRMSKAETYLVMREGD